MNTDNDPVARLRAADPAKDVEPRSGFADEVIARTTGRQPASTAEPASVADLAQARARRPRWLAIASVAASIAIVGAAGYGLGATSGGPTDLAAAPPISLQTGEGPSGIAERGEEPAIGGGAADQKLSPLIYPPGYGRNHFTASGLSSSEGTATAYAFDPRSASDAGTVAALAAALGIDLPVELKDGSWTAGPQDGSAPSLTVSLDGTLSFYFQDPQINPVQCLKEGTVCEPTGAIPSEEAAIGALRSLLVAAGRDPGAFEFTSTVWEGSTTRTAEARPVVNGQLLDQAWSLDLAEAGVVNASGSLAGIVELGAYPVVSEQEAFERLSDPRFGSTNWIMPMAGREPAPVLEGQSAPEEWAPPTEPPATPSAGTPLSWPVNEVKIVSARLGLASQWQQDGSVMAVPAYEFTDTDGGVWSVIAVGNSKIDFD